MSSVNVLEAVRTYYTTRLSEYGATPAGVDWNSAESQRLRFAQLLKVCDTTAPFSILDYGCGYAALVDYLVEQGHAFQYLGFDIVPAMVAAATARHAARADCRFVSEESLLQPADFALASGILNVRLNTPLEPWRQHTLEVLDRLDALGTRGFAFNLLTSYLDPQRMRADLYYADPCALFDHCKRHYSRHVALLHDYGLYEFTILVRK
jgi:SAM-dependent methyltransferase